MEGNSAPTGVIADQQATGAGVPKPRGRFVRKGVFALVSALAGALLGAVVSDAYERWKPWKESDDAFVQKIADKQKAEFTKLEVSLRGLREALPAEGRDAYKALQQSLTSLERDSSGLVQQLDLAKREIASLRTVAESRGGVGAGYDFTLSANGSMDLGPGALIGVTSISRSAVRVNLTSAGQTSERDTYLRSGQSLAFEGAGRQRCWVALMSLKDGTPGAASFKTGCNGSAGA